MVFKRSRSGKELLGHRILQALEVEVLQEAGQGPAGTRLPQHLGSTGREEPGVVHWALQGP